MRSSLLVAITISAIACKDPPRTSPNPAPAPPPVQTAPTPTTDPWSQQIDAMGGELKPFDPKAHPDVVLTPVGARQRLACDLFAIDFPGRPAFDTVRDAKGRESLSATLERDNGTAFSVGWFVFPPGTAFNEQTALAEVRAGMQQANEKVLSETRSKVAGHDAVTFVSLIDVGVSIRVETIFIPLPAKRAVLQVMYGYPTGNVAEQKDTAAFVGSLAIR